jgi:hypothetical protein
MFYDTTYRHHQALHPSGLETFPAALHALITAADDCRRAASRSRRTPQSCFSAATWPA